MQRSVVTKLPLVDLRRQYKSIRKEVDEALSQVMDKGNYILGENVALFEKEFASYLQTRHVVTVASGTDAIALALEASVLNSRNSVTAANTFFAIVGATHCCRQKLKLSDVDEETYTMDPRQLERTLDNETGTLIPVHLYGQTADMAPILETAREHEYVTIEDAAQAHGANYKGRRAGSIGDASCFSFYPAKNLGAYGDGGAIATNNDEISDKVRALRNYGEERKYHHTTIGRNSRLDELQAAALRIKLKHLDHWNEQRRRNAKLYEEYLQGIPQMITPKTASWGTHVFHLYVIRCQERDRLRSCLAKWGVSTGIHYPRPLHLQPACKSLGYRLGDFPVSEKLSNEILSLPMFPELREDEIAYVSQKIKEFYQGAN